MLAGSDPPLVPKSAVAGFAANMSAGGYDCWQATGNLPDPTWSDLSFRELLKLAFKDKYIDSQDHPILRRLRGEV